MYKANWREGGRAGRSTQTTGLYQIKLDDLLQSLLDELKGRKKGEIKRREIMIAYCTKHEHELRAVKICVVEIKTCYF